MKKGQDHHNAQSTKTKDPHDQNEQSHCVGPGLR